MKYIDLNKKMTLEKSLKELLIALYGKTYTKYYKCLFEAVILVYEEEYLIEDVMTKLYPRIADKVNISVSSVERLIRYSNLVAMKSKYYNTYFHTHEHMTNARFISVILLCVKERAEKC